MLTAISTAHDAGIGLDGDYHDLEYLHETIRPAGKGVERNGQRERS